MAFSIPRFPSFSITTPPNTSHFPSKQPTSLRLLCRCAAAKQRTGGGPETTKKKKKPPAKMKKVTGDGFEIEKATAGDAGHRNRVEVIEEDWERYGPLPMPKPPAGFVLDDHGDVLLASNKRLVTIVDSATNLPLECVIRRIFKSERGDECMLLCPVDMPIQILKSVNVEGWSDISDEEVEAILPTAAYALAKVHLHLVHSGFCYTARGGVCASVDDLFEFNTNNGEALTDAPTEGIEIVCFYVKGSHYMIYTPTDPLLFVAVKDENGALQIAEDELLDDPAVISAIDEETEFNALVEAEEALLDSSLGKL